MAAKKKPRALRSRMPAKEHMAPFNALDADKPLLLLPVRLETRFKGHDLKIRIYPDQIHLNEHETVLTDNELSYGQKFWEQYKRARSKVTRQAAVHWLLEVVPGRRAAWVARQTRPVASENGKTTYKSQPTRNELTPSTADCLPHRFAAVGFSNGIQRFIAFGKPVPEKLAMSSRLEDAVAWSQDKDTLPVDAGFSWMVDYDEAVNVGMGITVSLKQRGFNVIKNHGLTLFVVGLREQDPLQASASLEQLMEAHLYTDGLEFVPQGTPTNNTDVAQAGWTAGVDDVDAWFHRELADEKADVDRQSMASRLSQSFGLTRSDVLARALHGLRNEEASMHAMNVALWPVTWGRYFNDLLAPEEGGSILPQAALARVQELFYEYVRGGAPLPVLGIGAQPYGVLPVLRTREGESLAAERDALERILLMLKERWREALPEVPRLDPVQGDAVGSQPKDDAVVILGSLPHPGRFIVRRLNYTNQDVYGRYVFPEEGDDIDSNLQLWVSKYIDDLKQISSIDEQLELLDAWEELIDGNGKDYVTASLHGEARALLTELRGLVNDHRARQVPLEQNAEAYFTGVYASDRLPSNSHEPKIAWAKFTHYFPPDATDFSGVPDQEWQRALVQPSDPAHEEEASRYLRQLVKRLDGTIQDSTAPGTMPLLYQLLESIIDAIPGAEHAVYRDALETLLALAEHDVEQLELRFRETMGLASYRLDAWFTALAQERLHAMRAPRVVPPTPKDPLNPRDPSDSVEWPGSEELPLFEKALGIQLGAYGWVQDLKPDLKDIRESQGFIHAPSLGHAATAAVLRAGWNAHGTDEPDSLFAVDLRSERVRLGGWLLDGIRQGQALGEMLGYRFEREIREASRAEYIDDCRRAVLKSQGIHSNPRGPVDGLDLVELYHRDGVNVEDGKETIYPTGPIAPVLIPIREALDRIELAMDAVADVSIADSVHHLLQGNADRASATLDAITTGEVAPPELRALETPRPGATITHRITVFFGENEQPVDPAGGRLQQNIAETNSALDAWLGHMLGDLNNVVCSVSFLAVGEEAVPAPIDVTINELGISPTSIVLESPQGQVGVEGAWGRRVATRVLSLHPGYEGRLVINFDPLVSDARVSFQAFALLAGSLCSLVGRSRPMDARDFELPGTTVSEGWDVEGAERRVTGLYVAFGTAVKALEVVLQQIADATKQQNIKEYAGALRNTMIWLANLGLPNAIPSPGTPDEAMATLHAEARAVARQGRKRIDEIVVLESTWLEEDNEVPINAALRMRRAQKKLETLVGRNVPLLPNFLCADPTAVSRSFAQGKTMLEGDSDTAMSWLGKVAKVREDVARLDDVLTLSELILDEMVLAPSVCQLPDQDVWVATTAPADRRKGYLCVWALEQSGLQAIEEGTAVSGMSVDDWIDQIPATDVMTGVAMHFDAPTSRAPQSLLLMVTPEKEAWSFDLVVDSLIETFETAQLRAVDPAILDAYGHQIPAIYPPKRIDAGVEPEGT